MLKNLSIKNIALIDSLEVDLNGQLSVLSGETGAGKSIIVDSLAFVLGDRADKNLIKSGEDKAFVEAVFDIEENSAAYCALKELGMDADTTVVLSRSMTIGGKNECRINGRLCALSVLKAVSSNLADIFGQSEHINILKSDSHIKILDAFDTTMDFSPLINSVNEYKDLKAQLNEYGGTEAERERAFDLLGYEIKEIESADISEQEENELYDFKNKVTNVAKIANALKGSLTHLTDNNISSELWLAYTSIASATQFDKDFEDISLRLSSIKYDIDDIVSSLEEKVSQCDYNPSQIDRNEERLEQYKRLKKKYGATVKDVLSYLENSKQKYYNLIDATARIEELNAAILKIKTKAYEQSIKISDHRKSVALSFCDLVTKELYELGIKNAAFTVQFADTPSFENFTPSSNGFDSAEFMFSANVGEPLKPLAKVISGGEMSRFLLAVKNITAKIEQIPTMVFDEIDVGLSGEIAQMVAKKIANISRDYQCIVITHLPQVAAMGDDNYIISKSVLSGKTRTSLKIADDDAKIKEIARLMGGDNIGEYSLLHAKEMVLWAMSYKKSLNK